MAAASARRANSAGGRSFGGVLTRSRASATAPATAAARCAAAASPSASGSGTSRVTVGRRRAAGAVAGGPVAGERVRAEQRALGGRGDRLRRGRLAADQRQRAGHPGPAGQRADRGAGGPADHGRRGGRPPAGARPSPTATTSGIRGGADGRHLDHVVLGAGGAERGQRLGQPAAQGVVGDLGAGGQADPVRGGEGPDDQRVGGQPVDGRRGEGQLGHGAPFGSRGSGRCYAVPAGPVPSRSGHRPRPPGRHCQTAGMTELLRSPLHDRHVALGAKLADFGGWEMPIEYGAAGGGVLKEHAAVREAVGVFDVSPPRQGARARDRRGRLRQPVADQRPRPDRARPGAVHAVLRRRDRRRGRRPDRVPASPTTTSS